MQWCCQYAANVVAILAIPQTGFGVSHFGLRVADVESAVHELRASGVEILGGPTLEPSGLRYAYIAAPDGVVVELTQY